MWFVTRVDVIPPREGIHVGSSEDLRRTPMPTAPIPRRVEPRVKRAEHGQIPIHPRGLERDKEKAAETIGHGS